MIELDSVEPRFSWIAPTDAPGLFNACGPSGFILDGIKLEQKRKHAAGNWTEGRKMCGAELERIDDDIMTGFFSPLESCSKVTN